MKQVMFSMFLWLKDLLEKMFHVFSFSTIKGGSQWFLVISGCIQAFLAVSDRFQLFPAISGQRQRQILSA